MSKVKENTVSPTADTAIDWASDGFVRVAAVAPRVSLANPEANAREIMKVLARLQERHVDLAVTPELSLTGYTCGDLFGSSTLLRASLTALHLLREWSSKNPLIAFAVGLPVAAGGALYNCAVLIHRGELLGLTAKTHLPNYGEFYERRWFAPCPAKPVETVLDGVRLTLGAPRPMMIGGVGVAMEICEDLWAPTPPSTAAALAGADVVLNLSASNDVIGKRGWLTQLVKVQSGRLHCAYAYAGAGSGESTTDTVYDGKAMIAENGTLLAAAEPWATEPREAVADIDIELLRHERRTNSTFATQACAEQHEQADTLPRRPNDLAFRNIDPAPFVPGGEAGRRERCAEITAIQVTGLARRLEAARARTAVIGVSGGLDSTLALLVAAKAMDALGRPRTDVVGVTMPCFGTTGRTHANALKLMKELGVTVREIDIRESVNRHFADIGHDPAVHDVTYENCQARERTQVVMDLANLTGGLVVGTGDLSELALGWATYNGDHMSMYGVNTGVPKTLVSHLVESHAQAAPEALAATLRDVLATPVSPELTPPNADGTIAQRTEDLVGPYRLHDFFIYHTLRHGTAPSRLLRLARRAFAGEFSEEELRHWLRTFVRRFFAQQFKRSCLPDGPKVGSVSLSPRADWRMPSDAEAQAWLDDLDAD